MKNLPFFEISNIFSFFSKVEEKPKQAEKIEKKYEPAPTPASKEKKIERADKDAEIDKRLVQRDEEVKKLNQSKNSKKFRSTGYMDFFIFFF